MGLQEQTWLMDGVRSLFGFLDNLVYSLVKWILFGIFDLANLSTNSTVFSGVYSRIYVILGIFMAFKLSFSFFQYIIDPESMTGKSDKSLSKLFTRTFVMLAVLVFLPAVLFGQNGQEGILSRAQRAFLPTLPKIIFGVNDIGGISSGGNNNSQAFTDSIEQSANDISVTTLGGFFAPPKEIDDVCGAGTYDNSPPIKTLDEFMTNLNLTCNKKGNIVIDIGIAHTGTKFYKYSYMWFISTVVGVLIAALLLGVTLGIAKRIFKLMILEVMAPIPIMSLIDPKGNKDGAFKKWSQSLISTFGDIFMKLGLVYMIIVFIHLIVNSKDKLFANFPENSGFRGTYLTILLILGLIFFAKEAPKFIKESLGFKGDGGGLFDDVKSIGKAAAVVGGAAIGTASALGGNIASAVTAVNEGHGFKGAMTALNTPGALIAGALRGGSGGLKGAGKNGNIFKGFSAAANKQIEANANKQEYAATGSTIFGRVGTKAGRFFTGMTPSDYYEKSINRQKSIASSGESLYNYLTSQGVKKMSSETVDVTDDKGNVLFNGSYDEFTTAWKHAQEGNEDTFKVRGKTFNTWTEATKKFDGDFQETLGVLWAQSDEGKKDPGLGVLNDTYKYAHGEYNIFDKTFRAGNMKKEFKGAKNEAAKLEIDPKRDRYKANAKRPKSK